MSDSWSSKISDLKSRIKDAVGDSEGNVDLDKVMERVRESVGKAGSDIDSDALIARVRETVASAEGKVDAEKIKQWVDDVDRDTLAGWFDQARAASTSAATFVETQGERLAERAPGALDKVVGAAKEAIGDFTGNADLAREGELQHLKGGIEERFANASDIGEEAANKPTGNAESKSG